MDKGTIRWLITTALIILVIIGIAYVGMIFVRKFILEGIGGAAKTATKGIAGAQMGKGLVGGMMGK